MPWGSSDGTFGYIEAGLPDISSSLTINSAGAHTHTRGTMETTGQTRIDAWSGSTSGCFYRNEATGTRKAGTGTDSGSETSVLYFKASNTWTGSTSSNGAHTHSYDFKFNKSELFGKSSTVQPSSLKVRVKTVYFNKTSS